MEVVHFPLFFLQNQRFTPHSLCFSAKCSSVKEECFSLTETMLQGGFSTRPYGYTEVTASYTSLMTHGAAIHIYRIFATLGKNAMIARGCVTVFLYRKNKSPIYIYTAMCYYVFGEDWELSGYFR